jgi:hypothetical protein
VASGGARGRDIVDPEVARQVAQVSAPAEAE